jgi:predicted 3-demethylubiquinone-9 3-methyltransferase (glyoxalase superfamily)
MQKITPFLWFDGRAEEATNFYTSIFRNSRILNIARSGGTGPGSEAAVVSTTFELDGGQFMALNGGPKFKFTEALSFFVKCETQEEIDDLWERLSEGGEKGRCGWLKDKFGVSWQIVPSVLGELLQGKDPVRSQRVMEALLSMDKLSIRALQDAYGSR